MKLTILGCHGPYPPAGGACSGYLLEHEEWKILLDCGNGVLGKLQQHINLEELDAVILTHLHSDHISDMFVLRYAVKHHLENGWRSTPLPVFTPDQPAEEYSRLFYKHIYDIIPIKPSEMVQVGPFQISFLETAHSIDCFAVKAAVYESSDTIVYSADTEYFEELAQFAGGASLFLCEASYLNTDLEHEAANHMSAHQAALLGKKARVEKLVLTHLPPFRDDLEYLEEAKEVFQPVQLAKEGNNFQFSSQDSSQDREWARLTVETDPIKASLLEGRLKSEGIPVMLRNKEAAGQIYGFTVGKLAEINVFIPRDAIQFAQEILKQINDDNPDNHFSMETE